MARPKLDEHVEVLYGENAGEVFRVLEIDTIGAYPRYLVGSGDDADWLFRYEFSRLKVHRK